MLNFSHSRCGEAPKPFGAPSGSNASTTDAASSQPIFHGLLGRDRFIWYLLPAAEARSGFEVTESSADLMLAGHRAPTRPGLSICAKYVGAQGSSRSPVCSTSTGPSRASSGDDDRPRHRRVDRAHEVVLARGRCGRLAGLAGRKRDGDVRSLHREVMAPAVTVHDRHGGP